MLHQNLESRSFTTSRKLDLYDQLLSSIDRRVSREVDPGLALGEWAQDVPIILDGQPFTFDRHEYLIEPYQDDHPFQVEMKAAQMGCTTRAMLRALYGCRYKNFRGVLYLFPSRSDVLDFSRGRVRPLIEENEASLGQWLRETDSAGLKAVWNAFLYLRGMQSTVGLKSIPVDMTVFDELDEAPQRGVDMALERMAHSEYKEVHMLSNPTLPDYGIDKAFQQTDQRYWLLKCEKSGHYTCMEDVFCQAKPPETPKCFVETTDGTVYRACEKCQAELNPSVGEWVAKKPAIKEKRGYHYSQLFSHFVDPTEILHQFRTTNNLTDFYNLKIGIPYVEATNRLSVEEVLALCGDHGIASSDPGPCSMGVDQGKDLHVVIGKRHPEKAGQTVHLGVYRDWQELDRLMKTFNISRAVVDALPEQRNARAFAERHRGKVFLNFYQEHQKGRYRWNEKDLTVACNRTESLDASHNEILNQQVILPKQCEVVEQFSKHLHNVAKRLEEDEESGSKRYVYVRLGEDHFRHALNYETMARSWGASGFYKDLQWED